MSAGGDKKEKGGPPTQNLKSEKNKEKQADHGLTVHLPVAIKKKKGGPLLKIGRAKKIRKNKRTTD